ncbi:hypothetical protein BGZ49_008370 [Haplosporangium sp. Z 27]|nr:hypothetical protein BGZ49_008370 [Haplosporangium sp. Z 27]
MPPSLGLTGLVVEPSTSFLDLFYDVILIEKTTNYRSISKDLDIGETTVFITFKEISNAFEIALKECQVYHRDHPKHFQSAAMVGQLKEAGLNDETRLRHYINANGYIDGIVSHRHEGQQTNGNLPGQNSDLGIECLIPTAASLDRFESIYSTALPSQQDMISIIVCKLRRELWHQEVPAKDLDFRIDNAVFIYGSRFFKQQQMNKQRQKVEESSSIIRSVSHISTIETLLAGLKIRNDTPIKKTYGLQGELKLPVVEPTQAAYDNISKHMMALYQSQVPSQECVLARERLMQRLQRMLDSAFPGDNLRLEQFGSGASGLGSESSDADLCITTTSFQKSRPYNDMNSIANILRRAGMKYVQPIPGARVPIVKFVDPVSRINCDINTNHVLGVHNSELIRCYTLIDDRVRPLLYNIKALVKKHQINDSSQSWLSSYAYVMMAIGFLQAQEPPILPSLQAQPQEFMTVLHVRESDEQFDCTFDRDYTRHKNFGAANKKSVGQLLIEFFEYYSRYFDYQIMEVNVRQGGGVRQRLTKGGRGAKRPAPGKGEKKLFVKDPFIRDRNVSGSCTGRHLNKVWMIFEYLYLTLSKGEFQKAFEPISEFNVRIIEEGTVQMRSRQRDSPRLQDRKSGQTRLSQQDIRRIQVKEAERKRKIETQRRPGPAVTAAAPTVVASQQKVQPIVEETKVPLKTTVITSVTSQTSPLTDIDHESESENSGGDDDQDPQSRSRRRRSRRANARRLHQDQIQISNTDAVGDASTSNVPSSFSKPKSEKNVVAKPQPSQSIIQPSKQAPAAAAAAVSNQKKPDDKSRKSRNNSKKKLQEAFPVLEKTRKRLLESKKSESGASTVNAGSSNGSLPSVVKKKVIPLAKPAVKPVQ